nr:hypothetical protein [Acholeplasmatales bacterium]
MKAKFYGFMVMAASLALLTSCNNSEPVSEDILNGGFESCEEGKITNWTKTGAAFSYRGIVSSDEVNGIKVEKVGKYFFSGIDGGTQQMTGTLTSAPFKLTGTGKIAFKMGAGKNNEKVFIEFLVDNEVVLKVSNTDYNEPYCTTQMVRKIADLSKYIDKEVTIRITDNDNSDDFSYVNVDDFVVCKTEEELKTYEAQRTAELALYSEPPFEEDETSTTIQNPGFETGDLTGWKILSGTAFTKVNICPTSQYYWNDRSVYGYGEYYLDGSNNGATPESAVGSIRSTKFTLAGDGYISFMIGAAPTNCYVALCSGVDDSELIKVTNKAFNDPKLPLTLMRVYMDASSYKGQVVYLKVVDNNPSSGFAFMNVDDFRVSLTADEVKALQLEQFNKIKEETYTDS